MNNTEERYHQQIQDHLKLIELEYQKFSEHCLQFKAAAEVEIAALDKTSASYVEQETQIKLRLKSKLDSELQKFELEMRRRFGDNLTALEAIYDEKKSGTLIELEKLIQNI